MFSKITLTLTLVLLLKTLTFAQPKLEYGIGAGVSNHLSDTQSPELFPKGTNLAYGVNVRYFLNPSVALKFNYMGTKLSGDEKRFDNPWRNERAFKYNNGLHELAATIEWDMRAKRRFQDNKFFKTVSPYLFAGAGIAVTKFDVDYNFNNERNPIAPANLVRQDMAERKNIALAIPIGGGIRFDLSRTISLHIESSLRPTFSDYLDGISKSGNSKLNDWYGTSMISLSYRILPPDADNDGVADAIDFCPNQPGRRTLNGCPDKDQDGIADKDDRCPDIYGSSEFQGCPDQDADGLPDIDDICPDIAGVREMKGCPDRDNDKVTDAVDECPDVAGTINGCPDSDKDGIADKEDKCPTTAGKKAFAGCPDSDDDGIVDAEDVCPNQAGLAIDGGCPPKDTDHDGIIDRLDKCPEKAGIKEENGCPLPDSDGDGIADKLDRCPTLFGSTRFGGCPDSDGDGVEDSQDACPKLAGSNGKGCPTKVEIAALKANSQNINVKAPKSYEELNTMIGLSVKKVKFNSNSDVLIKSSYSELNRVSALLKANPKYDLNISGHTDDVGDDKKNLLLSERRAKRCHDYLVGKGVTKSRLTYRGFGETQPIMGNDTPAGRNENRRVEFDLIPK
jgi:OmpA-OmpF porin, OOP family